MLQLDAPCHEPPLLRPGAGSAEEASPRTVLGVVPRPEAPDAFPGLYATSLPERPFVRGGSAVLLNTQWANRRRAQGLLCGGRTQRSVDAVTVTLRGAYTGNSAMPAVFLHASA